MAPLTLDQAYQLAVAHTGAGRLAEAEALCRQILTVQPTHAGALHRLGVVALATGHYPAAVDLLSQAVTFLPSEPSFHSDLGAACRLVGQFDRAASSLRHAVALDPNLPDPHLNLAELLTLLGQPREALESARHGVALRPDYALAHNNLGTVLATLGEQAAALDAFQRAVALQPGFPEAWCNAGTALSELGRLPEASAAFARAIALRPAYPEACHGLGHCQLKLQQWELAMASFQRALSLDPHQARSHNGLGQVCLEIGRSDEALQHCRRAIELQPDLAEAHGNLAVAHTALGEFAAAHQSYRRALQLRPDFPALRWNRSLLLLLEGEYEEGWREYEQRRFIPGSPAAVHASRTPSWTGQPITGQTLIVHAEEGFGDTVHFARYLPLLRERAAAARVIFVCQPEMVALLASIGPAVEVVAQSRSGETESPAADWHALLQSLPLLLEKYRPLRTGGPYLEADSARRAGWRSRLNGNTGLRVGLAWAGNPAHRNDRARSIDAAHLLPLLQVPGATFYSLQVLPRGDSAALLCGHGLIDHTVEIRDFADTAALIAELDLVISVDSAAAHLAGALGRPVWTLLPAVPDWRWGLQRENTPWYPSMWLFRQSQPGDWRGVIQRVAAEVEVLARTVGE